ncbi:MAG: rhodanese-like domain-containing protein [Candidatus Edwardsbacteria bacterium]|nr:rhodanese-like domain-containing protein [Candidatus Edwardsbacteria bacterium]
MTNPFQRKGMIIAGMIHISGTEALQATRGGALLVDLRPPLETDYKKFDVPEVLYIAEEELATRISELSRYRPVIVADSVGLRSKNAVKFLMDQGFVNVANLNGGILDWEHDGMPLVVDLNKQLSGSCTCRLKPRT